MQKKLYLSTKKSIAFDAEVVERINKKAEQVDPRLYFFAYYKPKTLPKDIDSRGCFILAVLNMYGLLWDCGKMVLQKLFKYRFYNQSTKEIEDIKYCQELVSIIFNVRTCICHNNSDDFFYNSMKSYECGQYFINITGALTPLDAYKESQWKLVCEDFFDRCDQFANVLDRVLDQLVLETDVNRKADFVRYWIDSISEWYGKDQDLIEHIFADVCQYRYATSSRKNIAVTKGEVFRWVEKGWRDKNKTLRLATQKEYYDNYIAVCRGKLFNILCGPNCPKPAFPLEVLKLAAIDALTFKT